MEHLTWERRLCRIRVVDNETPDRRRYALHETGHAWIAELLGSQIAKAFLRPDRPPDETADGQAGTPLGCVFPTTPVPPLWGDRSAVDAFWLTASPGSPGRVAFDLAGLATEFVLWHDCDTDMLVKVVGNPVMWSTLHPDLWQTIGCATTDLGHVADARPIIGARALHRIVIGVADVIRSRVAEIEAAAEDLDERTSQSADGWVYDWRARPPDLTGRTQAEDCLHLLLNSIAWDAGAARARYPDFAREVRRNQWSNLWWRLKDPRRWHQGWG